MNATVLRRLARAFLRVMRCLRHPADGLASAVGVNVSPTSSEGTATASFSAAIASYAEEWVTARISWESRMMRRAGTDPAFAVRQLDLIRDLSAQIAVAAAGGVGLYDWSIDPVLGDDRRAAS